MKRKICAIERRRWLCADVRGPAKNHRSTDFRETTASFRHVSWSDYREAYRGRSKAEFVAKCGDSLRELEETAYWLDLLVDGKIVAPEKLLLLRKECDELIAIFVTILKRSKESSSFHPY